MSFFLVLFPPCNCFCMFFRGCDRTSIQPHCVTHCGFVMPHDISWCGHTIVAGLVFACSWHVERHGRQMQRRQPADAMICSAESLVWTRQQSVDHLQGLSVLWSRFLSFFLYCSNAHALLDFEFSRVQRTPIQSEQWAKTNWTFCC